MRKWIFIAGACLMTLACKKGGPPPQPAAHINTLSASVNGVAYKPDRVEVSIWGTVVPGARSVVISTSGSNRHGMSLTMNVYDGTLKTFNKEINMGNPVGCYSSDAISLGISCGFNGEIVLSSIDREKYKAGEIVNGTFYFETDSTVEANNITNGKFSVFVPDN